MQQHTRWVTGLAALLMLALASGCAPTASRGAAPAGSAARPSGGTSSAAGASAGATAAADGGGGDAWSALQAAALKEGRLTLSGTISPEARQILAQAFQNAHGIPVDFQSLTTAEFLARADREFKAGAVSFDAATGVSNCYQMAERGQIENFRDVLILPEATDPAVWRNGRVPLFRANVKADPDFVCGSQYGEEVQPQLFVNPQIIPPGTIATWDDLLKPEFKGKIAGHDPRGGGGGQGTAISIMYGLGEDFFVKLYREQGVTLSRDYRQLVDWISSGRYPIDVGNSSDTVANMQSQGVPIQRIFPANGPDAVTAGSSAISLMKNSPHPNAAKLFANWLHTKEGQEAWERANHTASLRTDTSRESVVPWVIPQADVTYKLHDGQPDFYYNYRAPIVERIQDILGR
jgi:iron(III) transport system substrate-binding protein